MKLSIAFGVLMSVALSLLFDDAVAQTSCIDYNSVGVSDCRSKEIEKEESLLPVVKMEEEKEEPQSQQTEVDKKVEDYLKYYDKPPREFVEFNVNPTLENAVKWAQKYREINERNKRLTVAWAQAQKIYKEMEAQGEELPPLASSLPDVPDYGLPMPKGFGGFEKYSEAATAPVPSAKLNGGSLTFFGDDQPLNNNIQKQTYTANLNTNFADNGSVSAGITPLIDGRIGGSMAASGEPILINYYFSAQCPFCQKFEPEFQQVIKELGDKLDVTCIDMSPKGADPKNIQGKVDCKWRPLLPNEMQIYGVKATPTLIISRSEQSNMERLSGYIAGPVLKRYLLTGEK